MGLFDSIGGFVDDAYSGLFGDSEYGEWWDPLDIRGEGAADAATSAAGIQAGATVKAAELQKESLGEALALQRESRDLARGDLAPFREAGVSQLAEIQNLLTPEGQVGFIQDNPFFDMLAQDAQRRIFNQAGASSRGYTGGTAQALQNSIMLLGNDLVGQDISRRGSLLNLGQASAAGQAAASQDFGQQSGSAVLGTNRSISDLITQGANASAAGITGAANARSQGSQNIAQVGSTIASLFI